MIDNLTNEKKIKLKDEINQEDIPDIIRMIEKNIVFAMKTKYCWELCLDSGMVTVRDITKDGFDGQFRSYMYPKHIDSELRYSQDVRVDSYNDKRFNLESSIDSEKNCEIFFSRLFKKLKGVSIITPKVFSDDYSTLLEQPKVRDLLLECFKVESTKSKYELAKSKYESALNDLHKNNQK